MRRLCALTHAFSSPLPVGRAFSVGVAAGELELQSTTRNTGASASSKTEQKPSSVPSSEDDLVTGVPLEQYKPRPSRSRSLKFNMDESIDYSRRPESVAKKTRRTRTMGEVDTTSTATTPEKVRQICDMGFTPMTTKKGNVSIKNTAWCTLLMVLCSPSTTQW